MRVLLISLMLLGYSTFVHAEGMISDILAYHKISPELATAGQITEKDVSQLSDGGVELVVNLAIADEERNASEAFWVTSQGISYFHIPVDWQNPTDEDLALFFAVMDSRADRKTLVHCFANYRASAFVFLYRVLHEGIDPDVARKDLEVIWTKEAFEKYPKWKMFIDRQLSAVTDG